MFQSALICTDFTDGLARLVNFVPSLAASGLQRLIFLHVVPFLKEREIPRPDEEKIKIARDRLTPALTTRLDGVEVKVEIVNGKPSDQIINVSKTYQPDVIFLGMPNRSRINEQLFGSTTIGVCQRQTAPILTVRPQLISTYTSEELDLRCRHLFRYLLLPYDGSESAHYLIEQVKSYAQRQTNKVLESCLVAWIVDESGRIPKEHQLQQAKEKVAVVKENLLTVGLNVITEVRQGEPMIELLALADQYDISAIATSSSRMGTLKSWSVPSFTSEIIHRSWHPVLYFPPK
jgi:nucleotide-binding universal stress UspA family protein